MRWLWSLLLVLLFSCGGKEKAYTKAGDALDAGREYLRACMEGDFDKAAFFMVPDEKNKQVLKEVEANYRAKDKEGRQQLRTASININAIRNLPDSITRIEYSYSFDKLPQVVIVVKHNGDWLVDAGRN